MNAREETDKEQDLLRETKRYSKYTKTLEGRVQIDIVKRREKQYGNNVTITITRGTEY